MTSDPEQASAIVLGRYTGTVGVLSDLLIQGGVVVLGSAAGDGDDPDDVRRLLTDLRPGVGGISATTPVVVLTIAPGDPTLTTVRALASSAPLVAVVWHPADELPPLPPGTRVVRAGAITRTLAATVTDLARLHAAARG